MFDFSWIRPGENYEFALDLDEYLFLLASPTEEVPSASPEAGLGRA